MFIVDLWESNPDLGNDDHSQSFEFETLEEAQAKQAEIFSHPRYRFIEYVEITNDATLSYTRQRNPNHKPHDHDLPCREFQMQQAMLYGCQGWNDFEGM